MPNWLSRRFAPSPDALVSRVGEDIVILHLGRDSYYGLNALGAQIWEMMKQNIPLPTIRDRLAEEYGVEGARIEADMEQFLDALLQHDMLVEV